MGLLAIFHTKLELLKINRENELKRNVDRSHCKAYLATFTERVQHILDHTTERFARIPFPTGCGSEVEKLLQAEQVPYHNSLPSVDSEKTNTLFVLFNLPKNKVDIMLEDR